jgi:hypothetical protein
LPYAIGVLWGENDMFRSTMLCAVGAAISLSGAAEAASLAGDTVTVRISNSATISRNAIVGPDGGGPDLTIGNTSWDFNASTGDIFTLNSGGTFPAFTGPPGSRTTINLRSLDFGAPLTGFVVLSSWTPITLDFLGADEVRFSFDEGPVPQGDVITARFEVGVVPEPGAWALMIVGFGVAGAALRRRSAVSVAA